MKSNQFLWNLVCHNLIKKIDLPYFFHLQVILQMKILWSLLKH